MKKIFLICLLAFAGLCASAGADIRSGLSSYWSLDSGTFHGVHAEDSGIYEDSFGLLNFSVENSVDDSEIGLFGESINVTDHNSGVYSPWSSVYEESYNWWVKSQDGTIGGVMSSYSWGSIEWSLDVTPSGSVHLSARAVGSGSDLDFYNTDVVVNATKWNMVTLVFNRTHVRIFVDGVSSAGWNAFGGDRPIDISSAKFSVAVLPYNVMAGMNGLADEVGYWDRMLTESEISVLYNGGKGYTLLDCTGTTFCEDFAAGDQQLDGYNGWSCTTSQPAYLISQEAVMWRSGGDDGSCVHNLSGSGYVLDFDDKSLRLELESVWLSENFIIETCDEYMDNSHDCMLLGGEGYSIVYHISCGNSISYMYNGSIINPFYSVSSCIPAGDIPLKMTFAKDKFGFMTINMSFNNTLAFSTSTLYQPDKVRSVKLISWQSSGNWTVDDVRLYADELPPCVENWTAYYANDSCNSSDAFGERKLYYDLESCGTTSTLPGDNGSISGVFGCNYCSEDISEHFTSWGECALPALLQDRVKYWVDENFVACCDVTGLPSDCHVLNGSYTNSSEQQACKERYSVRDFQDILIDILGTAGASVVKFLEVIVIILIVGFGIGMLSKAFSKK